MRKTTSGAMLDDPHEHAREFTRTFAQAEHALKRSGYLRAKCEVAGANWGAFARDLGPPFFEAVANKGIATTLIRAPPTPPPTCGGCLRSRCRWPTSKV